ncbi:MAG: hypothetical protein WBV94_06880 [Blastocatellia bacterium]
MKVKAILSLIAIFIACVPIKAQEWGKYVPEKQRKDIFKKSLRSSGVGAAMGSGHLMLGVWLTDPMARVIISNSIDRERLTNEEAEKRFQSLRVENEYTFLVATQFLSVSSPFGSRRSAKEVADPLFTNELFLQRSDDRKNFSKGQVKDRTFDIELYGFKADTMYIVSFPKSNRSSESIIRDISDKIELQFTMNNKKVVFEYKLKDFVTRLEDL